MPELGEIRKAREIGKTSGRGSAHYIRQACVDCDKPRWVMAVRGQPISERCFKCANAGNTSRKEEHHLWRGGQTYHSQGYIYIRLFPGDFFYPMVNKGGYVLEHRLVVARHRGRLLLPWEVVHHKNGVRNDNRIENLELLPHGRFHLVDMATKNYIKRLERQIEKMGREISRLKERELCGVVE